MQKFTLTAAVTVLGIGASVFAGGATFTVIGPGDAVDMTPDGTWVVGNNGDAWLWSADTGVVDIPGGSAVAISDDGSIILGEIQDEETGKNVAALWTENTGWISLGGLPGETGCDANLSNPYDLSGAGDIAVGLGWEGCSGRAFRWTEETGMVALPQIGINSARANVISTDGSTIGGWDEADNGPRLAAFWTECDEVEPLVGMPSNPEGLGEVWGFSSNGSVVVGNTHRDINTGGGFRWINGELDIVLALPGTDPTFHSVISTAVTDDGSVVVGTNISGFGPFADVDATYWTPGTGGAQKLQDVLNDAGAEVPENLRVAFAPQMSPDGTIIVGTAREDLSRFAYIATLPGSSCPEDVNGDGEVGFDDLLAVLAAWGPCPK